MIWFLLITVFHLCLRAIIRHGFVEKHYFSEFNNFITGGYLLYNIDKVSTPEEGRKMIAKCLKDGSAMAKFYQLLCSQGVSEQNAYKLCYTRDEVFSVLKKANTQTPLPALKTGELTEYAI